MWQGWARDCVSPSFSSLGYVECEMTAKSLIVGRRWMGTAMSDCPLPPPPLGVSRLSWFSRIRHEEKTPGASGQFCPSSRNSCHFKRRDALDFRKLSLGMGAPPGNSVMALRGLLSITPRIIAKCAHLIFSTPEGNPLCLLYLLPISQKRRLGVSVVRQANGPLSESVRSWLCSV